MTNNIIEFPRASARPSANASSLRAPLFARPNYAEGLSSGVQPVAVTGGTRRPPSVASASSAISPDFPGEVEVRIADIEIVYMLIAGVLSVAIMTLVLL